MRSLREHWKNAICGDSFPDLGIHGNFARPDVDDREELVLLAGRLEGRCSWIEPRLSLKRRIDEAAEAIFDITSPSPNLLDLESRVPGASFHRPPTALSSFSTFLVISSVTNFFCELGSAVI